MIYDIMIRIFLYRHVEISSNKTDTKFVFTIRKDESMPQGKIGFDTFQVRFYRILYYQNS
jgi:hypothetical protein